MAKVCEPWMFIDKSQSTVKVLVRRVTTYVVRHLNFTLDSGPHTYYRSTQLGFVFYY
jgi:hypothetical protein